MDSDQYEPNPQRKTGYLALSYLRQTGKWSEIYQYLISNGYKLQDEEEEQKSKRALMDQDTMTMALLVYLNNAFDKPTHTVSSLSKAMDNSDYNARKAMERWVSRTIRSIAGYQIIDFYIDQHQGERTCIRLEATDLLINFIENHLFVNQE